MASIQDVFKAMNEKSEKIKSYYPREKKEENRPELELCEVYGTFKIDCGHCPKEFNA